MSFNRWSLTLKVLVSYSNFHTEEHFGRSKVIFFVMKSSTPGRKLPLLCLLPVSPGNSGRVFLLGVNYPLVVIHSAASAHCSITHMAELVLQLLQHEIQP